jgi:glycosyltransferase involved in cell wall biosynthesis
MAPRRLRVLFVLNHLSSQGGAERFVAGLAMHLPRDRVEPRVCSTGHGEDQVVQALEQQGVPHTNLERSSRWQVHRLFPLAAMICRHDFDVVHTHTFGSNVLGSVIARACRVPVVIAHEHTWSYRDDRVRMWLDGHVVGRLADRFLAVSELDRKRMITLEGVPPDKVVVMPTGYIPRTLPVPDQHIRAQLGIPLGLPLVCTAAVLRKQKALDVLLDAHAILLDRLPDAHLVIAGEGECRAALEGQIERLGVRESVHLVGKRPDVDAVLQASDAAALSSDWEGLPLFVFECMAAGTPLVATDVGGLPEIVQTGRSGILVPPRNPPALAQALATVLSDRALARRLAFAARQRLDEFRIENVAERFAAMYEELAFEARARRQRARLWRPRPRDLEEDAGYWPG